MKASAIFAFTGLLAVVQAQSQCISVALAVPSCATSCLQSAAGKVGCGPLDFACQCGPASSAAINSAAIGCVLSTCGPQTGLTVQTAAAAVCSCAASAGSGSSSAAKPTATASAGSSASMPMSTAAASKASGAAPAGSSAASSSGASSSFVGAGFEVIMSIGAGLAVFLGVVAAL